VSDETETRMQAAFVAKFRYDEASGVPKAVFVRKQVARIIRDIVLSHERDIAEELARNEVFARSLEQT
jgi:hypothetical protein